MGQRNHDPGEGGQRAFRGRAVGSTELPPVEEEGGAQGPNRADGDRTESVHLSR